MRLRIRRDDAEAREGGFTLVEVLVTITIIAILFVAVAQMLNSSLRAVAAAKARARGNDIATQGIEDLQRFSFNNLGLCAAPPGTAPAGLDEIVPVNCASTTADSFEEPCNHPDGTIPDEHYTCTRNNIVYTVKRYVAWVDSQQTTKRLAVFVEWDDLVGRHQISQQSSLRAPDQGAILGLAPPTFSSSPSVLVSGQPTGSTALPLDPDGTIASPAKLTFSATTTNLRGPASAPLAQAIPPHTANAVLDIKVSPPVSGFPNYNGFPVTVDGEVFTVIAGAGTQNWKVVAKGTSQHSATSVHFAGDKVFASIQTIGDNDSPAAATVFLDPVGTSNSEWSAFVDSSATFRFGTGSQHVSFGILRAADGKTSAAFATPAVSLCRTDLTCPAAAPPALELMAESNPGPITLGSGGELTTDLVVKVRTRNVTNVDVVTVSFLTKAGALTLALIPNDTCEGPATMTPDGANNQCVWTGTLGKSTGYRFTTDDQPFYFAVQQILDTDPATVDDGSTAVVVTTGNVVFQ